jgi:hypothetical protein
LAKNGHLVFVYRELDRYGITNHRVENGGKHNQLKWSLRGSGNTLIVPKTPSDHRAPLNLLTDLRKQLKAANLSPVAEQPKRERLQLVSSKRTEDILQKKVVGLAEDVDALTDLVLDIAPDLSRFTEVAAQADTVAQDSPIKFRIQAEVPPAIVGSLLAYLIANGIAMKNVRISPLKAAAPEAPARETAPIQAASVALPAPLPEKVTSFICQIPMATREPKVAPATKKQKRSGRPFAGSAICKLMQYLRDNGPQTTFQLGEAGFTGYAGRADRIGAFAYGLVQRGLAIQKPDGAWALTIEGRAKLEAERL